MAFFRQIFAISSFAALTVGLAACTSGVVSAEGPRAAAKPYSLMAHEPEFEGDSLQSVLPLDNAPASAESVWTLRAALNVAALTCASPRVAMGYNAMLARHKAELASVYAAETARYGRQYGAAGQARHDADLTRTYNRFSNVLDRSQFCADAERLVTEAAMVPSPLFSRFVRGALVRLDRQPADAVLAAR